MVFSRDLATSQSRYLKKVPRARHAGQKKKDRDKREKQVSIYTGVGQKDICPELFFIAYYLYRHFKIWHLQTIFEFKNKYSKIISQT